MELQTCNKCSIAKPYSDYYKDMRRTNNIQSTCKVCMLKEKKERKELRQKLIDSGLRPQIDKRYRNIEYVCEGCGESLKRTEFDSYGLKGARTKKCKECRLDKVQLFKGYEKWEKEHLDTEETQMFLNHLRRVTKVQGPKDLINKHRK